MRLDEDMQAKMLELWPADWVKPTPDTVVGKLFEIVMHLVEERVHSLELRIETQRLMIEKLQDRDK